MTALFQKSDSIIHLNQEQRLAIHKAARIRSNALSRGHLVLSVQVKEALESDSECAPTPPTDAARLIYQWDGPQHWQATAFDQHGKMLGEVVSDGVWIEADGRRWRPEVFRDDSSDSDSLGPPEKLASTWSKEVSSLAGELRTSMWPQSLAAAHVDLSSILASDLLEIIDSLYRDPDSGNLLWHFTRYDTFCDSPPVIGLWQWIQWRMTRLLRPQVSFEEYFDIPPAVLLDEALFQFHGEDLYPIAQTHRFESLNGGPSDAGAQIWRDPFRLENDVWLPRVCEHYDAPRDGNLRFSTALIPGECHIGEAADVDIRAVDMGKLVVAT